MSQSQGKNKGTLVDGKLITVLIFIIIILVLIILSMYLIQNKTISDILQGVGIGISVTILSNFLYDFYITKRRHKDFQEVLQDSLRTSFNQEVTEDILPLMNSRFDNFEKLLQSSAFEPLDTFETDDSGDLRLNKDLTENLLYSKTYFFKGVAGRRVSARKEYLGKNHHKKMNQASFKTLKMIMPHPKNSDLIEEIVDSRKFYRSSVMLGSSMNTDEIIKDIRYSIANLHHGTKAYKGTVEIAFQKHNSTQFRCEILDEYAYVTLYLSKDENSKKQEAILKFNKQSPLFQFFEQSCQAEFNNCRKSNDFLVIDKDMDLTKLNSELKRMGIEEITDEEMKNAEIDLQKQYSDLSKKLS